MLSQVAQWVGLGVGVLTLAAVVWRGGRMSQKVDDLVIGFSKHERACEAREEWQDSRHEVLAQRVSDVEMALARSGNGSGAIGTVGGE